VNDAASPGEVDTRQRGPSHSLDGPMRSERVSHARTPCGGVRRLSSTPRRHEAFRTAIIPAWGRSVARGLHSRRRSRHVMRPRAGHAAIVVARDNQRRCLVESGATLRAAQHQPVARRESVVGCSRASKRGRTRATRSCGSFDVRSGRSSPRERRGASGGIGTCRTRVPGGSALFAAWCARRRRYSSDGVPVRFANLRSIYAAPPS